MPLVYLNGALVPEHQALVSIFDHGLVTGDGVFETVVIRGGRPFALDRHLERLGRSAAVLGLSCPSREELRIASDQVLYAAHIEYGKLRLTVTGGYGGLSSSRAATSPTVIVAAESLPPPSPEAIAVIAPWPRSERSAVAGAKTISYAENVVALADAHDRGASEALFLNLAGDLCEGTGSNVFVVLGGVLVTPPLRSGCLAGVTRGLVLECSSAREADVAGRRLFEISEAFLTSTTRGVQPVSVLGGRSLEPCPGPLTKEAARCFDALVESGLH
ncbi:MAG: aminotransferase class IV [Acidimicrobiales bacterium]